VADPYDISGKYVAAVVVWPYCFGDDGKFFLGCGSISVHFEGPEVHASIFRAALHLTPTNEGGSISWACASGSSPDITKYLPQAARSDGLIHSWEATRNLLP